MERSLAAEEEPREPQYQSVEELLEEISGANGVMSRKIYGDYEDLFKTAAGASSNHHVWPGGYYDHVAEVMNVGANLYDLLNSLRPLPFSKSDVLLIMFLHDLEKPFKYKFEDGVLVDNPELAGKAVRTRFRDDLIERYGIELNPMQANALKYVEGIRDADYRQDSRVVGELGALCAMADLCSARLWYNFPLEEADETWAGARRINHLAHGIRPESEFFAR